MQQNQKLPPNVDPEFSHTEAARNPASDPVEKPSPPDPIIVSNKPGRINKKYGVIAALTFLLLEIISAAGATPLLIGVVLVGIAIAFIAKALGIRSTWAHLVPCALFFVLVVMVQKSFAAPLTVLLATTILTFRRADSGAELLENSASRNSVTEISHPKGNQKTALYPEGNVPISDGSPKSAHIEPGSEKPSSGGAISSFTGVVTFAERETKKSISTGDRGRVMEVRTVNKFWHVVRFRVMDNDKTRGASKQISVQINCEDTDIYLQEGDTITLIGELDTASVWDPGIINHSGKYIMIPKTQNLGKIFFWNLFYPSLMCILMIVMTVVVSFVVPAAALFLGLLSLYAFKSYIPSGVQISMSWLRYNRKIKRIRGQIDQLLKAEGSWSNRASYTDPHGIIEGACLFSRDVENPIEWVVFRMGMYDRDGNLLDRLVGAIPQEWLATELRKGDTIKWHGKFTTGKICRPQHVEVLSLKQR